MRLSRLRPATALLWVAVLLLAQAISVAHLHGDDSSDTGCVVCTQVKSQTAAVDIGIADAPQARHFPLPPARTPASPATPTLPGFRARAPPSA